MRIALVIATLLLCSCTSGYSKFYRANSYVTPERIAESRTAPPPKEPTLEHAGGVFADIAAAYARRSYSVIGWSSFNSSQRESDNNALAQGAKVGADLVVVIDPRYTGSTTASVPLTTPTTSTSNTTGTATAYGLGGPVTAYGNSTTTTYGSQTTYLPMTINRFDYGAIYLFKARTILGASVRELTDDERGALQSNKGVYVMAIADGAPAFKSDMLVGDVIVAIGGQPVYGYQAFIGLLKQNAGRTVEVNIVRGDQTLTKSVALLE